MNKTVIFEKIKDTIVEIRGQKVLIDNVVAEIYGVETKRVNEAVKNNPDKFPEGYIIDLNDDEWQNLKSKISTSSWGGKRKLSRNINEIMKTPDETIQKNLAQKSNNILEEIIEIESDVESESDEEVIETTTKFEFNLGFAKVSRSIKKVKNDKIFRFKKAV